MSALVRKVRSFPSVSIPSCSGGRSVEVSLIAQLARGEGDRLYAAAMARQRGHARFVDALDEPSARLGGMDLASGDRSSLYSFGVGAKGHPYHRHAGHRVFTAISGSGGAQLRFSSASAAQIERDPRSFLQALHYVDIPPDSLFVVRFGGGTWHQFETARPSSPHPALFALSCHTDELGGALPESVRAKVLADEATIPSLTGLLPEAATILLQGLDPASVPTTALALAAPADSLRGRLCAAVRSIQGRVYGPLGGWGTEGGFRSDRNGKGKVEALAAPPPDSLLLTQLPEGFDHEDTFQLLVGAGGRVARPASAWLEGLLEGFLASRPSGVSRLMALRNALVKPLGLRTSPLGCPVSPLLGGGGGRLFAGRFPVLDMAIDAADTRAQVVLGVDDKHLRFRSCVGVDLSGNGRVAFTLGTRVQCTNRFGRLYMAAIDPVHRGYIAPAMLRLAVDHALAGAVRARA